MADTGLPLMATVGGLLVAYLFLRRQLQNDRTLRRADIRRADALPVGDAMLMAAVKFESAEAGDPYWSEEHWPGAPAVLEAGRRARLAVPELFDGLGLVTVVISCWAACYGGALEENPPLVAHHAAVAEILGPLISVMRATGLGLISWDGEGPVPGESELKESFWKFLDDMGMIVVRNSRGFQLNYDRMRDVYIEAVGFETNKRHPFVLSDSRFRDALHAP
jgi:hypothetical protein